MHPLDITGEVVLAELLTPDLTFDSLLVSMF
jgi:hypothetical protein